MDLRRASVFLLALFALSLITSMAGMEIFGWSLFALALVTFARDKKSRGLLLQPVMLAAYGLVTWVGFGLWWNSANMADPWTALAEMRWVLSLIGLVVAFYMATEPIQSTERKIEKLLWPLIGVAVLISLYSISQYWTGADWLRGARSPLLLIEESRGTEELRYRPYGLFKMTLTYACSMAMFGLLPFCLAFKYRGTARFWILQACAVLIFLSVFLTFSRGVWISSAVAIVFLLWHLWRKSLLILPFVSVGVMALSLALSPVLRERVLSIADSKHESNSARVDLWRANWLMFKTHPILGVGYEQNGPPVVDNYYRELGITNPFKSHAHNNYLNFLSGTGLPGFLFFLLFIGGSFYLTWKNVTRYRDSDLYYVVVASLGAQIVLHVGGITEYNFGDAEVQYQYLAYVALNLALYARGTKALA